MNICCTMPGHFGDILWALPTCRALAEASGSPVDFATSVEYGPEPFLELIRQQPYIRWAFAVDGWHVTEGAPIPERTPPMTPAGYDRVIHLGYREWPRKPLPFEIADAARDAWDGELSRLPPPQIDLATSWIEVEGPGLPVETMVAFTDEWFELKAGIVMLLDAKLLPYEVIARAGSRWDRERPRSSYPFRARNWLDTARAIRNADVVLADCSAPHVLAVAMGTPVVVVEPSTARHHPIFWPLGMDGPQVHCVKGNDGKPTFDARHICDALLTALTEARR